MPCRATGQRRVSARPLLGCFHHRYSPLLRNTESPLCRAGKKASCLCAFPHTRLVSQLKQTPWTHRRLCPRLRGQLCWPHHSLTLHCSRVLLAARCLPRKLLAFTRASGPGGHQVASTSPSDWCHCAAHSGPRSLYVLDHEQRPQRHGCLCKSLLGVSGGDVAPGESRSGTGSCLLLGILWGLCPALSRALQCPSGMLQGL